MNGYEKARIRMVYAKRYMLYAEVLTRLHDEIVHRRGIAVLSIHDQ